MQPQLVTTPKPNTLSLDDVLAHADELGTLEGRGAETTVQFARILVEAAYYGSLDLKKDKHGVNRDDAVHVSERFFKARNKVKKFAMKDRSIQKMVCDHRKMIKLGGSTWLGKGQPLQTVNEFLNYIEGLQAKNTKGLNDAYNALKCFATAQIKSPSLLPDAERNRFAFKTEKDEKTEMEKLDAIRKAIKKTGDTSVQMQAAYDKVTERITNIVKGSR
jgi:uncharacterized protein YukE